MGRTNPTFRDRLREIEREWDEFRRPLRRKDQLRFERLFVYAREHADAAGHLNHPDPMAPVWMAIALEQEKRIEVLEERVESLDEGDR